MKTGEYLFKIHLTKLKSSTHVSMQCCESWKKEIEDNRPQIQL